MPEGSGGVALGQIGITAPNLSLDKVAGTNAQEAQNAWDTRSRERGFNDQLFITDSRTSLAVDVLFDQEAGSTGMVIATDQLGFNNKASLAANRHAIDSQSDTGLPNKSAGLVVGIEDEGTAQKTNIIVDGAAIGDSAVGE